RHRNSRRRGAIAHRRDIKAASPRTYYRSSPVAPAVFSIRNTMRLSFRSDISTLSPVSRTRLGMSITDSGSVHSTSNRSPAASGLSALRVISAGNGHFRPARSSLVVVILSCLAALNRGFRKQFFDRNRRPPDQRGRRIDIVEMDDRQPRLDAAVGHDTDNA